MHKSALLNCRKFYETYATRLQQAREKVSVVEIGSQDVNGSLRELFPSSFAYKGLDFVPGKGVDVILEDPYSLPLESGSVDIVLSSSCFEHSEMFWLVFLEALRVLKPDGLFYLNVPSNGPFHRYPVDCWRFYPDSGRALVSWARRNGMSPALLESFISAQDEDYWNDFVAVYVKDQAHAQQYPNRIVSTDSQTENALVFGDDALVRPVQMTEDIRKRVGP